MDPVFAPWIALACGIIGMLMGYFLGYRTGSIAGELAALKSTRSRRKRSRGGSGASSDHRPEQEFEDSDGLEPASRSFGP